MAHTVSTGIVANKVDTPAAIGQNHHIENVSVHLGSYPYVDNKRVKGSEATKH